MTNENNEPLIHRTSEAPAQIGQYLESRKEQIIENWSSRVRSEVSSARNLDHPILIDTIPAYIDNLVEALTPNSPHDSETDFVTLAQEHGGERARLTFYDPDELIREYQVFQDVLFESLAAFQLTHEHRLVIHNSIDSALREAMTAFALVNSSIREQFIAILTHDLRNPIGVIKMAAELTCGTIGDNLEARSLLGKIIDNAKRADRMIQDLLDATVVSSGGRLQLEYSLCDMIEIANDVVRSLEISHGDRFEIAGDSTQGYWCADSLRRAIENLCTNAIKYGDPTAPITIRISSSHGRVLISVHNEGPAIPVEEQEAIFQVFRRARAAKNQKKQGWGLGLALVRGVAESHGGSLMVDSHEGRGTTFVIDIPQDARPYQSAPISR